MAPSTGSKPSMRPTAWIGRCRGVLELQPPRCPNRASALVRWQTPAARERHQRSRFFCIARPELVIQHLRQSPQALLERDVVQVQHLLAYDRLAQDRESI